MIETRKITSTALAAILAGSTAVATSAVVPAYAGDTGGNGNAKTTAADATSADFIEPNEDGSTIDIDGDGKAESSDEFDKWVAGQTAAMNQEQTFLYNEMPNTIVTGAGKTVELQASVGNPNGDTLGVNEWTLMNDGCADQFELTVSDDGQSMQVRPLIKGATAFVKHTWTYVDTVHTEIFVVQAGPDGDDSLSETFKFDDNVVALNVGTDKTYKQSDTITMDTGETITVQFNGIDLDLISGHGDEGTRIGTSVVSTNADYVSTVELGSTNDDNGNPIPSAKLTAKKAGKAQIQLAFSDDTNGDSTVYTFNVDVQRSTDNDEAMDADFYVATDFAYDEAGGVAASSDGYYHEVGTGTVMMDPDYGTAEEGAESAMGMLYKNELVTSINDDGSVEAELGDIDFDGKVLSYTDDQQTNFINTYTVDWEAMAVNASGAMEDVSFLSNVSEDASNKSELGADGDDASVKVIGTAFISVLGNDLDANGEATPIVAYDGAYDGAPHTPDAIPFADGATDVEYSADGVNWSSDINTVAQLDAGTYTGYARATTAPNVKTVYEYTMNIADAAGNDMVPTDTAALPRTGDAGIAGVAVAAAGIVAVAGGAVVARRRLRR